MKKLVEYIIPFGGLKAGEHDFNYKIDMSFLKNFDNNDILDIDLDVIVKMIKNNRLLEFSFTLNGKAVFECDRCLEDLELPIVHQSRLLVKLENVDEIEDEIIYLKPEETEIDISKYVYENIIFAIPARKVHPENKKGKQGCNVEMIKKLEGLAVKKDPEETDPRWNELKSLLN